MQNWPDILWWAIADMGLKGPWNFSEHNMILTALRCMPPDLKSNCRMANP